MQHSSQVFMLTSVQYRTFSTAEIIRHTFSKHFQMQMQRPNYIFRIYVFAENFSELIQLNSLLWGDSRANRNEILKFYPHYLMNNFKDQDNKIFYDNLIFYTPIVLSNNYTDLTKTENFINDYYKNKTQSIVIFISDDRQELLPEANDICDYFEFGRFSTLVDIVYTSPIAVKNGRMRYRKYQQKNLNIKHLIWNK